MLMHNEYLYFWNFNYILLIILVYCSYLSRIFNAGLLLIMEYFHTGTVTFSQVKDLNTSATTALTTHTVFNVYPTKQEHCNTTLHLTASKWWSWTSYQSKSCWCWWSFWSGQSWRHTPSPPPLKKVNQTEVSLCPLVGRDGGPSAGCGCGGFLSPVTSFPVQSNICQTTLPSFSGWHYFLNS